MTWRDYEITKHPLSPQVFVLKMTFLKFMKSNHLKSNIPQQLVYFLHSQYDYEFSQVLECQDGTG